VSVQGASALRSRFRQAKLAFKDYGRNEWGPETVKLAKARVVVRTGATRNSIRIKSATQRRAVVQATRGARFLESGTQAHDEKARKKLAMKFAANSGTVFAKKVHKRSTPAKPFLRRSAEDAFRKHNFHDVLVTHWNAGA